MPPFLFELIAGAIGSNALLASAIILGTFILEDPTTVIVGVLAADGTIPLPLALASLYVGIIGGDLGLYAIGRLVRTVPRLEGVVDHRFVAPVKDWLDKRFLITVFSARFIPGVRAPTYLACGFFCTPFPQFAAMTVFAAGIWTTFLFALSYGFGNLTAEWITPLRWSIALIFLLVLLFIGRNNILAYRTKKRELEMIHE